MNNLIQVRTPSALAVGLSAAMIAGPPQWPTPASPPYETTASLPTFSFLAKEVLSFQSIYQSKFVSEIRQIYLTISEGQEPLGSEFEAIWDSNIESLYEA